jgi:hypothetical protein
MRIAYLAIQCKAPGTDRIGDFLFEGSISHRSQDARLASPVFVHLAEFYTWASQNGWETRPYDPSCPVGSYVQVPVHA